MPKQVSQTGKRRCKGFENRKLGRGMSSSNARTLDPGL